MLAVKLADSEVEGGTKMLDKLFKSKALRFKAINFFHTNTGTQRVELVLVKEVVLYGRMGHTSYTSFASSRFFKRL